MAYHRSVEKHMEWPEGHKPSDTSSPCYSKYLNIGRQSETSMASGESMRERDVHGDKHLQDGENVS